MPRPQQQITIMQVQSKMYEARVRFNTHAEAAVNSFDSVEFQENLELAMKAANDYETWKKVYKSLT